MMFLSLLFGIYIGGVIVTGCGAILSMKYQQPGEEPETPEQALLGTVFWPFIILYLFMEPS